jgi:arabinose-5-phosphate isomerase
MPMNSQTTDDIRKVLELEAQAIQSIPVTTDYAEVVELIFERVHQKGGRSLPAAWGKLGMWPTTWLLL